MKAQFIGNRDTLGLHFYNGPGFFEKRKMQETNLCVMPIASKYMTCAHIAKVEKSPVQKACGSWLTQSSLGKISRNKLSLSQGKLDSWHAHLLGWVAGLLMSSLVWLT
ncbi:hypothetical protein R6Q59_025950 [Mikania micrantha]